LHVINKREVSMKTLLLAAASGLALMGATSASAGPTGAAVIRVGGSSAETCYHAAAARDGSQPALSECNSAINQDVIPYSDLVATYVNRGILLLIRGDYRAAEADFNQAMALQPSQAEAWLNKGIARYQRGDTRAAKELFTRAIELRTDYAALAYFGRALANEDSGDVRAAYSDLRRASQLDPKWDAPREQLKRFKVVPKATSLG
jgi:tetratricopeptide (TPR) repeat protein